MRGLASRHPGCHSHYSTNPCFGQSLVRCLRVILVDCGCGSCVSLGGFWDISNSFFVVLDSDPEVDFPTLGDDFRKLPCSAVVAWFPVDT